MNLFVKQKLLLSSIKSYTMSHFLYNKSNLIRLIYLFDYIEFFFNQCVTIITSKIKIQALIILGSYAMA